MISFFLPMKIPSITAQEHQISMRLGKPVIYMPPALKDAKAKYMAMLSPHVPETPIKTAVRLETYWCYQTTDQDKIGKPKTTKPDCDNLIKLFQDCMTQLGFWKDDRQIADIRVTKSWQNVEGIYVAIQELR